jgi:gluconate kinase
LNYYVIGCDGTGKTTLVNKLSEVTGMPVVRGSSFELTANKNQDELFESFKSLLKYDNVIFDRFIYCNEVYAPLYKDYSCLSDSQRREIEADLPEGSELIYLVAEKETIINRFNTRGEEYVKEDKIETILSSYEESLSKTTIPVSKFNTTHLSTEEIVGIITGEYK